MLRRLGWLPVVAAALTLGTGGATAGTVEPGRVVRHVTFAPLPSYAGRASGGADIVVRRGTPPRQVVVRAHLPVTPRGHFYELWLYDSRRHARSLGAQVTDPTGLFTGAGELPRTYRRRRYLDISLEPMRGSPGHSRRSVLRARLSARR